MLPGMEPKRSHARLGTALAAVFVLVAWLAAGSAQRSLLSAQEMPAGVASDLVDRALDAPLDEPPAAAAPEGSRAESALAWFTMALATLLLVSGWIGLRRRRAEPEMPAGDVTVEATPTGAARETGAAARSARPPAPAREALALPPHVTEILERAARRRAEEAAVEAGSRKQEEGDDAESREGLDYVVPGYDPWGRR